MNQFMDEQLIDEQPKPPINNPRKTWIAFILSLLLPWLGPVYNGQPRKAAVFIGLLSAMPCLLGITRGITFFYGLVALGLVEIVIRTYIIIDTVKSAKRQQVYVLKPYNTWYFHSLIAIATITLIGFLDVKKNILGVQSFVIPADGNEPALLTGDYVMADMWAYRNKTPDYGDLALYLNEDKQSYLFRIIGRPNDAIEIIDNIVTINGKASKEIFIRDTVVELMFRDRTEKIPTGVFEEVLPNGHKHLIYKFKQPQYNDKANLKNIIVPSDSYYLLGDNRDNAEDSRYRGFVSAKQIKGRIVYSYWGKTATERVNINFRDR
jgi:signal peptidase I